MRKNRRKQLAECNSAKKLVEIKERNTGRKLTRRTIIESKHVE